jgi:adenylate kinase
MTHHCSTGIIFLGPPGSGKGTQAQLLAESYELSHISTGDILRRSIVEKTPLGLQAQNYVERGELVPDQLLLDLINEALQNNNSPSGWILDGFPRTVVQASFLDELLKKFSQTSVYVVNLEVPEDVLLERLLLRGRQDDTAEIIRRRLEVYHNQTSPVLDYYQSKGELHRVNGDRQLEEITSSLKELIAA